MAPHSLVYHRSGRSDASENARYYLQRNGFLMLERESSRKSRFLSALSMSYTSLRAANELRRLGRGEEARAIASAVYDAWRRRYGKRGTEPPGPLLYFLTHFWIFPAGFFRRRIGAIRRFV
jgi:hypothetical protein